MFDLIIKSMEIGYGLIYGGKYKLIVPCCGGP
jgi:hypothetical protein